MAIRQAIIIILLPISDLYSSTLMICQHVYPAQHSYGDVTTYVLIWMFSVRDIQYSFSLQQLKQ